jgi:energy-coupling factor transporter transmembrane protein EcfT
MAKLSKKTVKSQENGQILDEFLKGVSNMSPIFVVVAIMIAYAFSAIVDFKYYSDFVFAPLQDNGMSMFLGAFVSAFVFFVRAVTAFHSINMFSRGNKKAGVLSFLLTISITVFLLWEAPKEAQALCSTYPINLDAGVNILRCIVAISFVMEILVISSVWEKIVSNEDDSDDSDDDDEVEEKHFEQKPSQNGQHNGLGKLKPNYQ